MKKNRKRLLLSISIVTCLAIGLAVIGIYFFKQSQKEKVLNREQIEERLKNSPTLFKRSPWKETDLDLIGLYFPATSRVPVKCVSYEDISKTTDLNVQNMMKSQKQLSKDLIMYCGPNENKYLFVSQETMKYPGMGGKTIEASIYTYHDETDYYGESLDIPGTSDSSQKYFRLVSWYTNGDIIYSVVESSTPPRTWTYSRTSSNPIATVIEYCTWGISKGTSARHFNTCSTFNETKTSKYLKEVDLP